MANTAYSSCVRKFCSFALLNYNKLIVVHQRILDILWYVLHRFTRDNVIHSLDISIVQLVVIKAVRLRSVLLKLRFFNVILVDYTALATNRRYRIEIRVHSCDQKTRIIHFAVDNILRSVIPRNSRLQASSLWRIGKLHDAADIEWFAKMFWCKIDMIYTSR